MSSLSPQRIKEIEEEAIEIIVEANDGEFPINPPINLLKILEYNNIKLTEGVFKKSDIDGAYKRSELTIYISNSITYNRKAFTIAHELGHHFLHKDKPSEVLYRKNNLVSNDITETEANWFASSILMPAYLLKTTIRKVGFDKKLLAKLFGVSYIALDYRIQNLEMEGLIDVDLLEFQW